jgi:transcription termination factor Rho
MDPEEAQQRPNFEKLTPLFPDERIRLEHSATAVSERIIDLIAPIGKGQRGMVVSPPKAGKTTVLKQIAKGFLNADPDLHMIILLVDERPEEVTDWQRTVEAAEVVYSTFDKPPDQHIQITELVLERAKRLAEMGQDVAILLDSITRLARAYNLAAPAPPRCTRPGGSSARPATSRKAVRSRSSRAPSWRRAPGWTTGSSRSSRAPGTGRSAWTGSSRRSASSPPSTWRPPAPARRSCS